MKFTIGMSKLYAETIKDYFNNFRNISILEFANRLIIEAVVMSGESIIK